LSADDVFEDVMGEWIELAFPAAYTLNSVKITSSSFVASKSPCDFVVVPYVRGSWRPVLQFASGDTSPFLNDNGGVIFSKSFSFDNKYHSDKYRLIVTRVGQGGDIDPKTDEPKDFLDIAELEYVADPAFANTILDERLKEADARHSALAVTVQDNMTEAEARLDDKLANIVQLQSAIGLDGSEPVAGKLPPRAMTANFTTFDGVNHIASASSKMSLGHSIRIPLLNTRQLLLTTLQLDCIQAGIALR
jgi:hypothetical protein